MIDYLKKVNAVLRNKYVEPVIGARFVLAVLMTIFFITIGLYAVQQEDILLQSVYGQAGIGLLGLYGSAAMYIELTERRKKH